MLNFIIDKELCSRCGECSEDYPMDIIEKNEEKLPFIKRENEPSCTRCQHCLAVCPTGALSIHGRNPNNSQQIAVNRFPQFDEMMRIVRGRRSVRRYQNENVDPSFIRDILVTLANAPMGANRQGLTFTVIDDKKVMLLFQEKVSIALAAAVTEHVPEDNWFLNIVAPAYLENGPEIVFRSAPHLLVVSTPVEEFCAYENVILALAYFELLAQSAGLGTVWCGKFKDLLETVPEMKQVLCLPADQTYYAMLFGLPAVRYFRTVQRDDYATVRSVVL